MIETCTYDWEKQYVRDLLEKCGHDKPIIITKPKNLGKSLLKGEQNESTKITN